MITLYSNNCPRCIVLKQKLNNANITFQEENDINTMISLGLDEVPVLKIDDKIMNFLEAIDWINKYGGNKNEH